MSKFYPNCDQDGFRVNPNSVYVIRMLSNRRYFTRTSRRRTLTAWHFAGAKLFLCFNDAKVQAAKLRAKDKGCVVTELRAEELT